MKAIQGRYINMKLTEAQHAELERIATKRGMNKADVIRMCIDVGVDCHRDLEKVGIIPLIDFATFMRKKIKEVKADQEMKQLNLI